MAARLRMEYAALDACVDEHLGAAQVARDIDQERRGARLPQGSLGRLPQSDEVQAAFDQAHADAGESLRDIAEALRSASERVSMTRSEVSELDSLVGELFARMAADG